MSFKFSLGADPEFFIEDKYGRVKSIIGRIGGTKEKPKFITDHRDFAIQEDNVAAEYNIPPTYIRDHFYGHIKLPQDAIKSILGTDSFQISHDSAISFQEEELNNEMAWIFGCEPDFDAWNMCENKKPSAKDKNLRTAGGHVHVGTKLSGVDDMVNLVRAMDLHLGVWSVMADERGATRRQLYGKAGAFRPKPYGLEYRVLSNFWIFSEDHCNMVWDLTEQAINFVNTHKHIDEKLAKKIQHCINNGDKDVATTLKAHWF